ncbi:hypothetical protein MMC28_003877 [Mycoblastus sanguinarius]|nr:hypothetical protein [Mycoblastus sanguinarius]
MAANAVTQMASTLNDADPAGDLVLLIGLEDEQKSVRVSSKVLTLASPVFAAMLSPRFAEGHALSDKNNESVPSISLPDDDPEAVIWLCNALHFRQNADENLFCFPLLEKMAHLCDKYDLSGALSSWSHVWMQKWPGSKNGLDSYPKMLWIAYAFRHDLAFWRITRDLIRYYSLEEVRKTLRIMGEVHNSSLPIRLIGKFHLLSRYYFIDLLSDGINSAREDGLIQFQAAIEDIIDPYLGM